MGCPTCVVHKCSQLTIDDISDETLNELIATTSVFLGSKNREIVKSALGLIKLLTITLPASLITPHLHTLVPALLGWVHDHKNHFKQKTVHIFERMIRKFGFDEVYRHAPEGGERKVLEGIKKRKDRAKRKKGEKKDGDDNDKPVSPTSTQDRYSANDQVAKTSSGNAFDDILYNSDSDASDDDDDDEGQGQRGRPIKPLAKGKAGRREEKREEKNKRRDEGQTYIRNEGDEPMDLLSRSIAGGISSKLQARPAISLS